MALILGMHRSYYYTIMFFDGEDLRTNGFEYEASEAISLTVGSPSTPIATITFATITFATWTFSVVGHPREDGNFHQLRFLLHEIAMVVTSSIMIVAIQRTIGMVVSWTNSMRTKCWLKPDLL
jgi:hypothetical protein